MTSNTAKLAATQLPAVPLMKLYIFGIVRSFKKKVNFNVTPGYEGETPIRLDYISGTIRS